MTIGVLPDAVEPGVHYALDQWGFMAFRRSGTRGP